MIYGVLYGLNFSLLSLGFTLVFGVSNILNLAYGALYMTTAYLSYYLIYHGVGLLPAALLAVLLTVAISLAIFELHLKFARDPFSFMMGMLLSSLLLQYLYSYFFGGEEGLGIPGLVGGKSFSLLGVSVNPQFVFSGVVSLALVVLVWVWIERTSSGRMIQATSSDPEAAQLFGINVRRVIIMVFAVSSVLVGVAAVLLVPSQVITPSMWLEPFVIAFAVSIMAGLGKFKWVIPSAFVISFGQVIAQYAPFTSQYNVSDIVAFALVLAAIVLRPSGLGGGRSET